MDILTFSFNLTKQYMGRELPFLRLVPHPRIEIKKNILPFVALDKVGFFGP